MVSSSTFSKGKGHSDRLDYLKKKLNKLYTQLIEGIQDYMNSDDWKDLLNFYTSFHVYSFYNTALILTQYPEASIVAGYKKWLKLGRHVKKGEKGIAIYAPLIKKVKQVRKVKDYTTDEYGNTVIIEKEEEYYEERLVGFRIVHVFDISQTEGKPVGIEKFVKSIVVPPDDRFNLLKEAVEIVCQRNGIKVYYEELTGTKHGYYDIEKNEIHINTKYPESSQLKTLLHELAHAFTILDGFSLGAESDIKGRVLSRRDSEVIAESVSYIVSKYLGYDVSKYSFGYISFYSNSPETLLRLGNLIVKYGGMILDSIDDVVKITEGV